MRGAVAVLVIGSGGSAGSASDEVPPLPPDGQAVLNQFVMLDDEPVTPHQTGGGTTATDSAPPPTNGAATGPTVSSSRWRTVRPRSSSPEDPAVLGGQPAPWYRTGLGALTIVLVFVGMVYWIVRRWVPATRVGENGLMRVVARTGLTPKQHLALVQLGRRFVMVGVSPDRLQTLCDIDDPEEAAELAARTGVRAARPPSGFDEQLWRETAQYQGDLTEEVEEAPSGGSRREKGGEPLRDLLGRLRTLRTK